MPLLLLGSLGLPEILMIFALVLLLFGPSKLPEIGKALGKGIREFKKGTSGLVDSFNDIGNTDVAPSPKPVNRVITAPKSEPEEVQGIVVDLESETEEKK